MLPGSNKLERAKLQPRYRLQIGTPDSLPERKGPLLHRAQKRLASLDASRRMEERPEAAEWLILNDHGLPADLANMETEVCE
jgi:hypothetical protein